MQRCSTHHMGRLSWRAIASVGRQASCGAVDRRSGTDGSERTGRNVSNSAMNIDLSHFEPSSYGPRCSFNTFKALLHRDSPTSTTSTGCPCSVMDCT